MRNLNCRILILVGEGRLEWAEVANPLRLDGSVDLHEQRVVTRQQLRAKVRFLCLKDVSPPVADLCAFWGWTQVNVLALYFARRVSLMPPAHWSVPA